MNEVREIVYRSADYFVFLQLRREILRWPLGLEFSDAELEQESADIFLAAFDGDALVGGLILTRIDDHTVRMRQVAVREDRRGTGVGRALVEASEAVASERGYQSMILHARANVTPFYLRLGYAREGEEFSEVGIPHFAMVKRLES